MEKIMFSDKLSARVVIFRHYLQVSDKDNDTLSWSNQLFNDIVSQKNIIDLFQVYKNDFLLGIVRMEALTYINNFAIKNNIQQEFTISNVKNILELINQTKNDLDKYENFEENFTHFENEFLLIQYERFRVIKHQFDQQLYLLFKTKLDYINEIIKIITLEFILIILSKKNNPKISVFENLLTIFEKKETIHKFTFEDEQLSVYLYKLNNQYFAFSKNLTERFVRKKYGDLLNEITKTLHSGGFFVTPSKYEKIMNQVAKQALHIELLLSAYDGYNFETAQDVVRNIIPSLM